MTYDSPKTIRRRRQRAEDRPARRRAQRAWETRILTDEEWEATCSQHVACLYDCAKYGFCDAAGRHARSLVTMALERRARQIMRDFGRAHWKAMAIARNELLNCEVA